MGPRFAELLIDCEEDRLLGRFLPACCGEAGPDLSDPT
jgi:hypothetical protein